MIIFHLPKSSFIKIKYILFKLHHFIYNSVIEISFYMDIKI
uniref:Uncharacterized protein n=1 Tax=Staphylococcus epidermidis TaxID=1282 RepID=D2JCX4_STAEP|nr:hypothetical protein SAP024A_022 [Staphylococcus epidermidis]